MSDNTYRLLGLAIRLSHVRNSRLVRMHAHRAKLGANLPADLAAATKAVGDALRDLHTEVVAQDVKASSITALEGGLKAYADATKTDPDNFLTVLESLREAIDNGDFSAAHGLLLTIEEATGVMPSDGSELSARGSFSIDISGRARTAAGSTKRPAVPRPLLTSSELRAIEEEREKLSKSGAGVRSLEETKARFMREKARSGRVSAAEAARLNQAADRLDGRNATAVVTNLDTGQSMTTRISDADRQTAKSLGCTPEHAAAARETAAQRRTR